MKRIYKYPVAIANRIFEIKIPKTGRILTVQTQNDFPYIWVELFVENEKLPQIRNFIVYGTGEDIAEHLQLTYIGTFQLLQGNFIGHLYEVTT